VREDIFRDFSEIKAALDVHIQSSQAQTNAVMAVLRQICINVATDQQERTGCLRVE